CRPSRRGRGSRTRAATASPPGQLLRAVGKSSQPFVFAGIAKPNPNLQNPPRIMDGLLILSLAKHTGPPRLVSRPPGGFLHAKNVVGWSLGDKTFTFYGGTSRATGERSSITANSIIAIKGKALAARGFNQVPPLNNRELFRRDRHMCAYCGGEFSFFRLTRDH